MLTLERHAFRQFEHELKELLATLDQMGSIIQDQLQLLEKAVIDSTLFQTAKQKDKEINELEFAVEKLVMDIFGKYSPTGDELRFILTSLKISTALELMGDMAKNSIKHISKLEALADAQTKPLLAVVDAAGKTVTGMLTHIEQFNEQAALDLFARAQKVDDAAKHIVVSLGDAKEVKGEVKRQILLVTKNLERVADLATDIVKYCYYIHTGKKFEKPNQ